ncbi:hypothetical protein EFA46_014870 (plasmid) [Halarchaeum sp. CBA1220]|nr:hypothetical protein EFA46_014870 [Halarchaeum sp. CBA1220]
METTSHSHQGEWCLEGLFCRGPAARIRRLAYRLRDFDAVGRANVTFKRTELTTQHRQLPVLGAAACDRAFA